MNLSGCDTAWFTLWFTLTFKL